MQKAKHSKFKNTGILFELLTRQVTADILAGKDESSAKDLLFKYFTESKELGKEWQLYNFLLNEKAKDELHAEKYINVILKQREKLDSKKLTEQKYSLIKEIKENYPIDDLLKSSIKNYKIHASIYKIFENHVISASKFEVKELIQSRNTVTENLCGKKNLISESDDDLVNFYKQQNEDIRLLSYKLLVDSLNEKYKDLDNNQKRLLKEYINNISNTNSLNEFVEKEINVIKESLSDLLEKITDNVLKIKINEVTKQLESINCKKSLKDNQITVLLLSYELIKELKNQIQ
jgi:hypothetical protein